MQRCQLLTGHSGQSGGKIRPLGKFFLNLTFYFSQNVSFEKVMKGAVFHICLSGPNFPPGLAGKIGIGHAWQQCSIHTFADMQAQHRIFYCGVDFMSYFN
jgi:hypothetical protein